MKYTILILGGYGVFGKRIAKSLSEEQSIQVIVAGRNAVRAREWANKIGCKSLQIDISKNLGSSLDEAQPFLVINCCGPFQGQDYSIASECIIRGIHYIDLADARNYVTNFSSLNNDAIKNNVVAITGASTVPAISSAILDHFLENEFSEINSINYGVTPGNQTPRGIATVAAILSYVGKPFTTLSALMNIASRAKELFESSDIQQKRKLMRFMFTNLNINGAKLEYSLKKPFDMIVKLPSCKEWRRRQPHWASNLLLCIN